LEEIVHRNVLPKGCKLQEYQIESVLGKPGGFGITYLATDTHLCQNVAIKEYLPTDFAVREGQKTVCVRSSSDDESFKWGLNCFRDEAKFLARFNHPNIVRVLRYFEENGTAYMVMSYQEGESFTEYLKRGALEEIDLLKIVVPLLSGLEKIHVEGLFHRDIKPNNLYICKDGTPILLDFGSARSSLNIRSISVTSIITPGYAPLEQYDNESKSQGPWTDIYGMGAVMYRAISGEPPLAATRRVLKDPMLSASELGKGRYTDSLLKAIDWALQVNREDRPKTISEWRRAFPLEHPGLTSASSLQPQTLIEKLFASPQMQSLCISLTAGLAILLLGALLGIIFLYQDTLDKSAVELMALEEKNTRIETEKQLALLHQRLEEQKQLRKEVETLLDDLRRFENKGETEGYSHKYYDVVNVHPKDVLNIRSIPGHLSPQISTIPPNGKCVLYLGKFSVVKNNVWVYVQYKNSAGWVNSKYLLFTQDCPLITSQPLPLPAPKLPEPEKAIGKEVPDSQIENE